MVPAGDLLTGQRRDARGAPEFPDADDQRLIQQPARRKIIQQRRETCVEGGEHRLQTGEVVHVRVPHLDVPHVALNDRHFQFHKPAGQEQRLPVLVPPVAVARLGGLFVDIESRAQL